MLNKVFKKLVQSLREGRKRFSQAVQAYIGRLASHCEVRLGRNKSKIALNKVPILATRVEAKFNTGLTQYHPVGIHDQALDILDLVCTLDTSCRQMFSFSKSLLA